MLGKLSIAFLIVAAPALAQTTVPAEPAEGAATAAAEAPPATVAYKTKRICRSIPVVGSKMPRTSCTTKKIPVRTETLAEEEPSPPADPQR